MTTPLGIATEKRDIKENQKGQVFMLVASSTVTEDSCVWLFGFLGATTNLSIQKCQELSRRQLNSKTRPL